YSTPRVSVVDTAQPANQKKFQLGVQTQKLFLQALVDDESSSSGGVTIDRLGTIVAAGDICEKFRTTPMGHWLNVPYNATNFSAGGGRTWNGTAGPGSSDQHTRH